MPWRSPSSATDGTERIEFMDAPLDDVANLKFLARFFPRVFFEGFQRKEHPPFFDVDYFRLERVVYL